MIYNMNLSMQDCLPCWLSCTFTVLDKEMSVPVTLWCFAWLVTKFDSPISGSRMETITISEKSYLIYLRFDFISHKNHSIWNVQYTVMSWANWGVRQWTSVTSLVESPGLIRPNTFESIFRSRNFSVNDVGICSIWACAGSIEFSVICWGYWIHQSRIWI